MSSDTLITHLRLDDQDVPVFARRNTRARRLIMRLDAEQGCVRITLPPGAAARHARAMVEDKAGWILGQWQRRPQAIPFADGTVLPLRGTEHVIRHRPDLRAGVRLDGEGILVSGMAEHLPRRLTDWLKREARATISDRVRVHADGLGLRFNRISLRDTRSRWGSCSGQGNLSFSWRLILAPDPVIDYVAAHEVAHLAEMNHGPRFWELVERRVPDWRQHRNWLNRHGRALFLYG